ncbi:MAG: hypothetical protein NT013_03365 [Planctomycetia bacterium]|nr:hypothetical protein [Planctomycetia bacterium]
MFAYCPTSPVLELKFAICDSPNDPYRLDAPRDLRDGNVQDFLAALLEHGEGEFILYSESEATFVGQCSFSLRIAPFAIASTSFPRQTTSQDLDRFWESLKKAADHLNGILPARRDFNQAKELYYKNVPL